MKQPQPPHLKENEEVPWCPNIKEEEEKPQLPHIKEEQEERCISQEGERFEGLDEFPVICVIVKNEDEIKGEIEERDVEPPSSSSTNHMTREADGDHCEGTQANNLLAPLSESEDTTSHSSDTDDENSKAGNAPLSREQNEVKRQTKHQQPLHIFCPFEICGCTPRRLALTLCDAD
ncbi:uncharacterized protein LOC133647933 isoform X2 [Entelurus aequoreus]|uniref:uncharacterized protein LOC133647933 isoform X2 n=1 Tax=Entelurus aequoreus TaxID=161455 RepID=UPI002B1E7112|nr:uncharacterized protein LOC133647933 isoform X2 [Entelurus aequoreus]